GPRRRFAPARRRFDAYARIGERGDEARELGAPARAFLDQPLRRQLEAHDVVGLHVAVPEVDEARAIREERAHDLLDLALQSAPELARRQQPALDERLAEALAAPVRTFGVAQLVDRDRAGAHQR